jgi:hypothetical protein
MKDKLNKIVTGFKRAIRIIIAGIAYMVISTVIVSIVAIVLKAVLVYGDVLWDIF